MADMPVSHILYNGQISLQMCWYHFPKSKAWIKVLQTAHYIFL